MGAGGYAVSADLEKEAREPMERQILALARQDATVMAHLQMQSVTGASWTETLEKLVLALSQEKQAYFEQAADTAARSVVPIQVPGWLPTQRKRNGE